jgi:ankyrin repeat protein
MDECQKFESLCYCIERNDLKNAFRLLELYGYSQVLSQYSATGCSPLHIASKIGNVEIMKLLLSYGVIEINKLESKIYGGYGAIHYTCSMGYADCLQLLIDAGADINLQTANECHETPLHICCKRGRTQCARFLIMSGADVNSSDGFGHNPSFWAYSLRHFSMLTDLNLPQPRSATAQEHFIAMGGNSKVFQVQKKKAKGKGKKKKK